MNRLYNLAPLLLLFCSLFAQTAGRSANGAIWEPPIWFPVDTPKATIPNEMLATLSLSGLTITLEKTKMEDVANRLKGTFGGRGDAGESLQWLCFHGADLGSPWVLWLESGEINGGTVGSFQWQLLNKNAAFDSRCRMLGEAKIKLPIAVRLGTTKAEVLRNLGPATLDERDGLIYVHQHDENIQGEPFTSINFVGILLRAGQVWAIEASRTTTS